MHGYLVIFQGECSSKLEKWRIKWKHTYIFSSDTLNIHLRLLSKIRKINNNKEEEQWEEHEQEKKSYIQMFDVFVAPG